jgi:outer membrane protein OmpA-like peptidoglycan-associated protein
MSADLRAAVKQKKLPQEDHWIPLSDVMTGLMMIFMLIAIVFMIQVQKNAKEIEKRATNIKNLTVDYSDLRAQLYKDLSEIFKNDLQKWNAVLLSDLSIRFKEPNVQFDSGKYEIKPRFSEILNSFFPKYVDLLYSEKYRNAIEEIRIEGHTSSKWEDVKQREDAYFKNMELSQNRTREVLQNVLRLPEVRSDNRELVWVVDHLTANGLSYSKRIFVDGVEDPIASQRVEFRVRTNAEKRLDSILRALSQ